jgi:methylmalonyl-CoA/ethylmalonyl-CoA epimerase
MMASSGGNAMSPIAAETHNASFGLSSIGQIAITITDLERAVAFYRDALGMKLLFQVPGIAFFDCAGIRLMLSPAEKSGEQYSSILYFKVADILAAAKTLESRGAPFDQPPHLVAPMPDHDLWMAFFRDPDRNLLALMSEVRPAAA